MLRWVALLVVTFASSAAHAQNARAESLFEAGEKLMTAGKYAEACEAFESSNRVETRAGTLIRLGDCREKNHQLASAWSAYKDALTRVKDPKKRAIASAKVAELEPKLSYLTIHVGDAAKLDGLQVTRGAVALDPGEWNRAVAIDAGDYVISAHAPGRSDWQTTTHVPDASAQVSVDVPTLEPVAVTPPSQPPAVVVPRVVAPPPVVYEAEPSSWTGRRKAAVVFVGVAIASAAGGGVVGVYAKRSQSDAEHECPVRDSCTSAADANALIDRAKSRARDANILFGVAGAAAIAAGVLWFTGSPEHARVSVAPDVARRGSTFAIEWSF
jgi:hypothetical protein